jgi:hypothetical protein
LRRRLVLTVFRRPTLGLARLRRRTLLTRLWRSLAGRGLLRALLTRLWRSLAGRGLLRALLTRRLPAAALTTATTRAPASLATLRAGRKHRHAHGGDDEG